MIYETYLITHKFVVNLNQYTKEDLQNLTVLQIKQLLEEEKISVRKMSEDEVIASHQPRC